MYTCANCGLTQKQRDNCARCGNSLSILPDGDIQKPKLKSKVKRQFKREKTQTINIRIGQKEYVFGANWLLEYIGADRIENLFRQRITRTTPVFGYFIRVWETLIQAFILIIFAVISTICSLFILKYFWAFYTETPIGRQFLISFPEKAKMIKGIFSDNLFELSMELVTQTFIVSFLIASVCQFIFIARYFYHSQGFFGRLVIWSIPMIGAVSYRIQYLYDFDQISMAFGLSIIPTICLYNGCFKFAEALVPELGDIFQTIKSIFRWIANLRSLSSH